MLSDTAVNFCKENPFKPLTLMMESTILKGL